MTGEACCPQVIPLLSLRKLPASPPTTSSISLFEQANTDWLWDSTDLPLPVHLQVTDGFTSSPLCPTVVRTQLWLLSLSPVAMSGQQARSTRRPGMGKNRLRELLVDSLSAICDLFSFSWQTMASLSPAELSFNPGRRSKKQKWQRKWNSLWSLYNAKYIYVYLLFSSSTG